jgi:hypothetical protein
MDELNGAPLLTRTASWVSITHDRSTPELIIFYSFRAGIILIPMNKMSFPSVEYRDKQYKSRFRTCLRIRFLRKPDHPIAASGFIWKGQFTQKYFKNHAGEFPLDAYGNPPYLEYPVVRDSAYEEFILNDESQKHQPFRFRAIIEAATAKVIALLVHKPKGDPDKNGFTMAVKHSCPPTVDISLGASGGAPTPMLSLF